jgi:aspartyl-tRNA(Asn)/glutamyl-tRNA(Gln) amidotransferase subunit A
MTALTDLTIKQASDKLKSKEISVRELTQAHFKRVNELNPELNAYIEVTESHALAQCEAAQNKINNGSAGLLEGIPVAVKDLFCTQGFESSACSNILKGYIPQYESTVTEKLFASGGIMVGKTNMDEFAMGSANTTSARGNVINPWQAPHGKPLTPGGSSGGSSAAVAAKMCMAALGSDTGGSIRQPAAFTGIVGIKPTYGRCSRYGMIAFASSLDQAGVFTRNVEDAAIMLEAIAGFDPKDSTSVDVAVPNYRDSLNGSLKGLRVGIPKEYSIAGIPSEIEAIWQNGANWLREQGAEIVEISLPHTAYALPVYYIIAPAEASSNLARYDGVRYGQRVMPNHGGINEMYEETRAEGFGDEVKRRIIIGTYVLSAGYYDAYYTKALKIRRLIANDFANAFTKVDVILTPSAPSEAFAIGENQDDPVKMYLNDIFTVTANLAGIPGISVPAGLSANKLPLGLQLLGKHFDEATLFRAAYGLEKAANFNGL